METQRRAEALDRHVGEREELVEHDAVIVAEDALVVGLERRLRRRQRRPLRIVDEIEREPRAVAAVAERVEALQPADRARRTRPCRAGGRRCPPGSTASRRRSRPARAARNSGRSSWPRLLEDREVAAVHHAARPCRARAVHHAAEMRIELGRAAGDVERRDPPALQKLRAPTSATRAAHLLGAVRARRPTWQCTQDWLQR